MRNLTTLISSLFLVFLMLSPSINGELFKWVDDAGNTHYGDSPPENAVLKEIKGSVTSYTSVSVEAFEFNPDNITKRNKTKKVVMYSTSWCGYCKKAAHHFRSKKIPFSEYDIEKSARAASEYKKLNGRGVPVILIGDRRMNGFDANTFDQIYYAKS